MPLVQVSEMSEGAHASDLEVEFEAVLRSEAGHLFAIAVCILRSPATAEDAVQDTMVLAWRSWGALRNPDRRRVWLTRICVRRCLRLRESERWKHHGPLDHSHAAVGPEASDVDWERAFVQLSPPQRAVVTLHYLYGHRLDDCAGLMGCRPGTARRHLARALTKLRKEIGDE